MKSKQKSLDFIHLMYLGIEYKKLGNQTGGFQTFTVHSITNIRCIKIYNVKFQCFQGALESNRRSLKIFCNRTVNLRIIYTHHCNHKKETVTS